MESVLWFMDNAYKYEDVLMSWPVTIIGAVLYLVCVYSGQAFMKSRTRWDPKLLMQLHNVILLVWSVAMFSGGLYETITAFQTNPFLDVYCASKSRPGSERIMTGKAWFWIWLFFASKFYEFLDTAFIVVRKSPLLVLHVYVRLPDLLLTFLRRVTFSRSHHSLAMLVLHLNDAY